MSVHTDSTVDGLPVVRLANAALEVTAAPGVGGRIVSLRDRSGGPNLLWHNPKLRLERLPPGAPYDPNFYGGLDEQLPSDLPETVAGRPYPDHGELWTLALDAEIAANTLVLRGRLPVCGLRYERRLSLRGDAPLVDLDYRLTNDTPEPRPYLWKLHLPVPAAPGDTIFCPAAAARVADPAWSRQADAAPFAWAGEMMLPEPDGTAEFLFLEGLRTGVIGWRNREQTRELACHFDPVVFPCCWLFATFGQLDGLYTAVIEPANLAALSVADAVQHGICPTLAPGETIATRITLAFRQTEDSISAFPPFVPQP